MDLEILLWSISRRNLYIFENGIERTFSISVEPGPETVNVQLVIIFEGDQGKAQIIEMYL